MSGTDLEEESKGQEVALSLATARAKAELDQRITTAKAYGRSIRRFADGAKTLVTLHEDVAAGMIYSLPRAGKAIEGPSIRMAEVLRQSWGNCETTQGVVETTETEVIAEGIFYDLENNMRVAVRVSRRITDKDGNRYNADMITVTGNAACSIASRNAILSGIGKAFWQPIYMAAKLAAVGDIKTMEAKRTEAIAYVAKYGITEERVLASLGAQGIEDIDIERLATLRSRVEQVKAKEMTIDEAFPAIETARPESTGKGKGSDSKKKPPTKEPQRKTPPPAATKKATATKPEKPLETDQITVIRDKLKEEGVLESALFASLEVGDFSWIAADQYKRCIDLIDELSKAGAK